MNAKASASPSLPNAGRAERLKAAPPTHGPRAGAKTSTSARAPLSPELPSVPPARASRRWIALHLPALALESWTATLDPETRQLPLALLDGTRVAAVDATAAALGVRPGQQRATALALASALRFGQADAARDARALCAVAYAALQFTPAVALHSRDTVLLEVSSTLRLFGGPSGLEQRLSAALAALGHHVVPATAPTALGAALLARWASASPQEEAKGHSLVFSPPSEGRDGQGLALGGAHQAPQAPLKKTPGCPQYSCAPAGGRDGRRPALEGALNGSQATRLAALRALLDTAPAALLWPAGAPAVELLQGLGLCTLGELRALPRDGLARRLGPALLDLLDRARGDAPDPQDWVTAPERLAEQLELHARADTTSQLQHAAGLLLARLVAWARARQGRVQRCVLGLRHEPRHRAADAVPELTPVEIALAEPSADADHLQGLLRERLARLELPAPVTSLELRCDELVHAPPPGGELFPTRAAGQAGLARLLERLQARLGEDRVQRLEPVDDHRPERAAQTSPTAALAQVRERAAEPAPARGQAASRAPTRGRAASAAARGRTSSATAGPPALTRPDSPRVAARLTRPAWLLPEPQPLPERGPHPCLGGQPLRLLAGPERIESGWWDDALAARDYFVAQTHDGALTWIYRSRLPADGAQAGWFLQGWFG